MYRFILSVTILAAAFNSYSHNIISSPLKNLYTYHIPQLKSKTNFGITNRTHNYPTRIIRFETDLNKTNLSCDSMGELYWELHHLFDKTQEVDIRFYALMGSCSMNIFLAEVIIDSYSDEAEVFLQQFINENNGNDFHGAPIEIESAKGVIIDLNIRAKRYQNVLNLQISRLFMRTM